MKLDYFERKQAILLSKIDMKYIRIKYYQMLSSNERLLGIIGARGVGKTTLLLQYIKKLSQKALYVSGDDIEFTNTRLYDLIDEFYALGGRVVVVDEVHQYKNWAMEVKNLYDAFPDLTLRISGSSMVNILYEKYDLSRRLVLIHMKGLSFREYFEMEKGIELEVLPLERILHNAPTISKELMFKYEDLYAKFRNFLEYGTYPFYLEGLTHFEGKLFNAIDKIIHEDIPSLNKIDYTHVSIFQKLLFMVASSKKPFSVSMAALSREFGISEPTLYIYMEILDRTGIFKSMKKYSANLSKKPQKLLFANSSILYAYTHKFGLEPDIGTVRETFFVNCFDEIFYSDIGDFRVGENIFEVGGKNKEFTQIKGVEKSYLAVDTDFTTHPNKIPLWLFGLLE